MSTVDRLRANVNPILAARDRVGAALKPVFILTRTWSGEGPGDGECTESKIAVQPSPRIVEFLDDDRIKQGGVIEQGDIFLKMISRSSFPIRESVDCSTEHPHVEKFYEVGGSLYQVRAVQEKLLTWSVHLRKCSDQRRF